MSSQDRRVEIEASGVGTGKVRVDGTDMSSVTRRVTVDVDPNERGSTVVLHLKAGPLLAALGAAVKVDHLTSAALIDLGWTPPGAPAIQVLTESEARKAIFVLTWHPVALDEHGDPHPGGAMEIPLGEPWLLPGTDVAVGEFRLSTREVPEVDRG